MYQVSTRQTNPVSYSHCRRRREWVRESRLMNLKQPRGAQAMFTLFCCTREIFTLKKELLVISKKLRRHAQPSPPFCAILQFRCWHIYLIVIKSSTTFYAAFLLFCMHFIWLSALYFTLFMFTMLWCWRDEWVQPAYKSELQQLLTLLGCSKSTKKNHPAQIRARIKEKILQKQHFAVGWIFVQYCITHSHLECISEFVKCSPALVPLPEYSYILCCSNI